jgi:hypothetical protein
MDNNTIWIVTGEPVTRGERLRELKVEELSVNMNLFLEQMSNVLDKTPEKLGKFQFAEFEIHAEVTAKGTLAILGSGGEIGAAGGLKFVFRRLPEPR